MKSGDLVVLDYGQGTYSVRLIGVEVPREGPIAQQARALVEKLVGAKRARIRQWGRNPQNELVSELFTDERDQPIQSVNLELLRAGLARRQKGFDFKYGELAAAELEAQKERRGLWATQPQP